MIFTQPSRGWMQKKSQSRHQQLQNSWHMIYRLSNLLFQKSKKYWQHKVHIICNIFTKYFRKIPSELMLFSRLNGVLNGFYAISKDYEKLSINILYETMAKRDSQLAIQYTEHMIIIGWLRQTLYSLSLMLSQSVKRINIMLHSLMQLNLALQWMLHYFFIHSSTLHSLS